MLVQPAVCSLHNTHLHQQWCTRHGRSFSPDTRTVENLNQGSDTRPTKLEYFIAPCTADHCRICMLTCMSHVAVLFVDPFALKSHLIAVDRGGTGESPIRDGKTGGCAMKHVFTVFHVCHRCARLLGTAVRCDSVVTWRLDRHGVGGRWRTKRPIVASMGCLLLQ